MNNSDITSLLSNASAPNFTFDCIPIASMYPELVDLWWVQMIFGILYSSVWSVVRLAMPRLTVAALRFVGVMGNLLVIYVAFRHRNISFSVRTVFIVSLASSDVLIGLFSLPITAVLHFSRIWVFPLFLCPPIGTMQGSGIYISSFTFSGIAVDRFLLIVYPTRKPLEYKTARAGVVMFWVLGYVATLPMSLFSKPIRYRHPLGMPYCGHFCEERWPGNSRQVFGLVSALVQFGLPLIISVFCYLSISAKISQQIRLRLRNEKVEPGNEARMARRRRHTNRMMLIMVACFICAYAPINCINIIRDFVIFRGGFIPEYYSILYAACHLISMSSIIYNPIIYGWFNEPFRSAVKAFLLSAKKCVHRRLDAHAFSASATRPSLARPPVTTKPLLRKQRAST